MYRKIIKAVSVILSVTMLMGITVFADTITDLQNQKNQKEKEIDAQRFTKYAKDEVDFVCPDCGRRIGICYASDGRTGNLNGRKE